MAAQDFTITYNDGSTQTLKVSKQYTDGSWLVLQDDFAEVLRVPADKVRSVHRADVADRQPPAAKPIVIA
jgi:hypothetical protein